MNSSSFNQGESTASNAAAASSSLFLDTADMNRNNTNNLHASTSSHHQPTPHHSHSHSHLGQQAVYMSEASEEHLMSGHTSIVNPEQTVLNLNNPATNIISMLGEAMNQPNGPLTQLTPMQQQELLQQVLQSQMGAGGGGGEPGLVGPPGPDQQQPPSFVTGVIKTLQSSLPFLIILVAKIFHQHLLGFFIVLGFMTTLHWSNRTLVNQVQLKVF
jgi:hypothetical protein